MKHIVLLGLVVALAVGASTARLGKPVVPAVFVLGGSTLDVGNNNHLSGKDVPRANVPFYGVDFPGGPMPTGRFSNGYNLADFIAKHLGFERSPLAYLVLKSRNYIIPSALTRGVSYASAGAGILDSTNAGNNIPLSKQLLYFASTKSKMEDAWGTHKVSTLLANSFFLLGIGNNDLFQTSPKTAADVATIYATLVSNYSAAIADLYGMGARKFGIINVGPIGCLPRVRVLNKTGACNEALNRYAAGFAAIVKLALANLASKLPNFSYSLADSFAVFNLQTLGFVNLDSACCGTGRMGAEGGELCMRNDTLCADRDAYLFWDSVHFTQQAAELGAVGLFDGSKQLTAPISFKQLAYKRY
ncbi:GDSL esterase/lipase At1g71691-like [Lolium rigidum]|uniref:GDSL esterase/lipase At1g71691-like n=1 Tax=Lolium rigidum TaxID=89674 RepID=UPI001F5C5AC7|nr:GDSL esterase/lipase At1g71691-like [Lolium rigidum]